MAHAPSMMSDDGELSRYSEELWMSHPVLPMQLTKETFAKAIQASGLFEFGALIPTATGTA